MGVSGNRGERLVELVRDAGGHLADGGEAGDMGQPLLQPVGFGLRLAMGGVVVDESHEPGRLGLGHRPYGQQSGKDAAVLTSGAYLAPSADNVWNASRNVPRDEVIMRLAILLHHQHIDVTAD